MKHKILLLIAVLMPIAAFSTESADTSAASNELAITQVYVDDTSIMIIGRNLLNGPWDRKVKLGEFGLLTIVGTPTDTLIEAALPEGITPGDYLLIVAGALKDKHNDTYNLTIGSVGPAGPAGADGEPGAQGVQGKLGPAGADGTTGAQGEQGKIGPSGADGAKGRQGEQGKIGPTGADGAMGERGKRGNRGYTGEDGAVGAQGVQGKIGPTGADGAEGAQGVQGKIGPVGADGAVGAQGVQGKIGPVGTDGAVGAQGTQGKIGPVGADGAVGAQGEQGKIGPAGADGTTGVQGEQGKLGPAGSDGAMGAQGVQGKLGPAGGDGAMGAQGEQGKIGPQGDPGNLALANMSCPVGEFLTGFGPTGDLICQTRNPACFKFTNTAAEDLLGGTAGAGWFDNCVDDQTTRIRVTLRDTADTVVYQATGTKIGVWNFDQLTSTASAGIQYGIASHDRVVTLDNGDLLRISGRSSGNGGCGGDTGNGYVIIVYGSLPTDTWNSVKMLVAPYRRSSDSAVRSFNSWTAEHEISWNGGAGDMTSCTFTGDSPLVAFQGTFEVEVF